MKKVRRNDSILGKLLVPFITHFRVMAQLSVFLSAAICAERSRRDYSRSFLRFFFVLFWEQTSGGSYKGSATEFFGRVNLFNRTYRHREAHKDRFFFFFLPRGPRFDTASASRWIHLPGPPRECLAIDEAETVNNKKVGNLDISGYQHSFE